MKNLILPFLLIAACGSNKESAVFTQGRAESTVLSERSSGNSAVLTQGRTESTLSAKKQLELKVEFDKFLNNVKSILLNQTIITKENAFDAPFKEIGKYITESIDDKGPAANEIRNYYRDNNIVTSPDNFSLREKLFILKNWMKDQIKDSNKTLNDIVESKEFEDKIRSIYKPIEDMSIQMDDLIEKVDGAMF